MGLWSSYACHSTVIACQSYFCLEVPPAPRSPSRCKPHLYWLTYDTYRNDIIAQYSTIILGSCTVSRCCTEQSRFLCWSCGVCWCRLQNFVNLTGTFNSTSCLDAEIGFMLFLWWSPFKVKNILPQCGFSVRIYWAFYSNLAGQFFKEFAKKLKTPGFFSTSPSRVIL
jgi:hypothetical protein